MDLNTIEAIEYPGNYSQDNFLSSSNWQYDSLQKNKIFSNSDSEDNELIILLEKSNFLY